MASFDVLICSVTPIGNPAYAVKDKDLVVCYTTTGEIGNAYAVSLALPEPYSIYGLPNITPYEVGILFGGVGAIWATAFIIRRAMAAF